jgi:hypothetical protein
MSSHESEAVLKLLQELSVLKELDRESQGTKSETEQRLSQQRQQEILDEIKTLAQQKKDNGAAIEGGEWVLGEGEA